MRRRATIALAALALVGAGCDDEGDVADDIGEALDDAGDRLDDLEQSSREQLEDARGG